MILDLDKLAKDESENWVWSGASIIRPKHDRALINLSRGGADATVTREFDIEKQKFVEGGFERPEAKGGLDWIDQDSTCSSSPILVMARRRSQVIRALLNAGNAALR